MDLKTDRAFRFEHKETPRPKILRKKTLTKTLTKKCLQKDEKNKGSAGAAN
jgi:hypothetical protein